MQELIGNEVKKILADAGYRGHNAPATHAFRVYTQGQKRGVSPAIKKQMKRRAAIEPVIGHVKNEHRMGRNYTSLHPRRPHQRYPRSSRLQLPPPAKLVERFIVPVDGSDFYPAKTSTQLKTEFFTDD
jgi:hypothetical protein